MRSASRATVKFLNLNTAGKRKRECTRKTAALVSLFLLCRKCLSLVRELSRVTQISFHSAVFALGGCVFVNCVCRHSHNIFGSLLSVCAEYLKLFLHTLMLDAVGMEDGQGNMSQHWHVRDVVSVA